MATLKEYFDMDFRYVKTVSRNITLRWVSGRVTVDSVSNEIAIGGGVSATVTDFSQKVLSEEYHKDVPTSIHTDSVSDRIELVVSGHGDPESLTKFIAFYIPGCSGPIKWCLASLAIVDAALFASADFVEWHTNVEGEKPVHSGDHIFVGRVFIYCDNDLSHEGMQILTRFADSLQLKMHFRGTEYAEGREKSERHYAFVSYDSRDRSDVALPIAQRLRQMGCPVWYDEFSLNVGDSLRESIERGIKECGKCILIVTPNFLSNQGWPREEFNAVFTRERLEQEDIILPIWHNVTQRDVYDYSPGLANRYALKWSLKEDEQNRKISQLYKKLVG